MSKNRGVVYEREVVRRRRRTRCGVGVFARAASGLSHPLFTQVAFFGLT